MLGKLQQIFRVPEVLHNICNMCSQDLPDMFALTLRRCTPLGLCVHIRQIPPAHVTYITYTMVMSYIKDAAGCIFMYIHLCTGWYVSYTPHLHYISMSNVLL